MRRGSRALETEFAGRADYHSGSRGRVLPLKRLRQADRSRSVASPYGGRRRAAVRRRYRRDAGQDMARAYLGVRRCHMQAAALGARLLASSWARSITRRARSVSRSNMPVPPFEAPASTHDAVKIHRVCSHSQDISRARARRIPGRPRPVAVCVTTRAAAVRPAQATLGCRASGRSLAYQAPGTSGVGGSASYSVISPVPHGRARIRSARYSRSALWQGFARRIVVMLPGLVCAEDGP